MCIRDRHCTAHIHAGAEHNTLGLHQLDPALNDCLVQLHVGDTVHPVSYTHLDVYKRQILSDVAVMILGVVMMAVGWNYATTLGGRGFYVCLLYTSRGFLFCKKCYVKIESRSVRRCSGIPKEK